MDKNFVLPVYPDSKDVPLPSITYTIKVFDAYGKEVFDYLNKNEYFIFNSTNKNFAFETDDMQTALSSIEPISTICKIISITKNKASYVVKFEATSAAFINSARMMENTHIVLGSGKLIDDIEIDKFLLKPFIDDIRRKYNAIANKVKGFPEFPNNDTLFEHDPSYYLAYFLNISIKEKLYFLREPDPQVRLQRLLSLTDELDGDPSIESEINKKVEQAIEKNQKEFILRAKMKAIKDELKPFDGPTDEERYDAVINDKEGKYPDNVKQKVKDEKGRLAVMPGGSQEAAVIKTYLDLLIKMPWSQSTIDNENMTQVKKVLDLDHYGLQKQKDRILEYLAVKSLTKSLKAPILCLFGPPGTGKTSLAISIAKALGRKFCKISLGGISDESEIRGHRKTYVGAMPGKIVSNIARVGVNNPVILLDEIDKIKDGGYHGDPASALLEVLDPEQNMHFQDNYLEETFDLSNVLFICTANNVRDIPQPLIDRLEMIQLSTYTTVEKFHIAVEHLIPAELEANGLKPENITFEDKAIYYMIENYTREAGVRDLRRKIGAVMRKFAVSFLTDNVKKEEAKITIDDKLVEKYLGNPIFKHTKNGKKPQVGIVNGLAYTDFGGEILPIEVNYYGGTGQLLLTGNLGKVMEESCRAAFSYIKSVSKDLNIKDEFWRKHDFHIHAPEGAVPKDGPSAGIALTIGIMSAATGIPIKNSVGMTGETDLRGNSMPIGGLREKSLAALREGLETILVPAENHNDVLELPKEVKDGLKIIEVKNAREASKYALTKNPFQAMSKVNVSAELKNDKSCEVGVC